MKNKVIKVDFKNKEVEDKELNKRIKTKNEKRIKQKLLKEAEKIDW